MKIKKYINVFLVLVSIGGLVCSCSDENDGGFTPPSDRGDEIELSISFDSDQKAEPSTRAMGNYDDVAEKRIYSLDVLIFKKDISTGEMILDGKGSQPRASISSLLGVSYDKEYKVIKKIENIKLTAGKRDIYIIANAPKGYFNSFVVGATKLSALNATFEKLENQGQGLFAHPDGTVVTPPTGGPIGGITPSDLHTNLTMCKVLTDVQFSNTAEKHYLGYTDGLPASAPIKSELLFGTNRLELERLVARVAFKKIQFNLGGISLQFEESCPAVTPNNYSYSIESVSLINVKATSSFSAETKKETSAVYKWWHGMDAAHDFFKEVKPATFLMNHGAKVITSDLKTDLLYIPVSMKDYDVTQPNPPYSPLWFYVFENDTKHPGDASLNAATFMVIEVRFNFISTKDPGVIKTVNSYYPIVVNEKVPSGQTKPAQHDYIKRNHQYGISVVINGLGGSNLYPNGFVEILPDTRLLKKDLNSDIIEVKVEVGENLFPWTGNAYK